MQYLILGFAPGLYWLWYFSRRDELEPEPKKLIFRAYFLGILSTLIAVATQYPLHLQFFYAAVIGAPVIEESSKFLIVWLFFYRNKNFDEPMDGIVYAAAVALGFASLENGLYLFRSYTAAPMNLGATILVRGVLSVPSHALFSSIWGYALARYKFAGKKKIGIVFVALLIAMLLHAAFNFLAIVQVFSTFGLLILVAVMWSVINNKIDKAEKDSPYATRSFLKWKTQKKTGREE